MADPIHIDKDLLRRLAASDEIAFRELFDLYKHRVHSFAFHLTRNEFLADEITQEIFIKVWTYREKLTEINYFSAWINTVIKNHAKNYFQRMLNEQRVLRQLSQNATEATMSTEMTVAHNEYLRLLEQAIDQLPPQQKKVYLLSRKEGLRHEAIASQLGISSHTVRNHMKAALHSLRHFLQQHTDIPLMVLALIFFKK